MENKKTPNGGRISRAGKGTGRTEGGRRGKQGRAEQGAKRRNRGDWGKKKTLSGGGKLLKGWISNVRSVGGEKGGGNKGGGEGGESVETLGGRWNT